MRMTGGEAMIRAAIANGIATIFGLPGAQVYALFEGIHETKLELIVPRHEQTAAYMAMGYAKSTGKTGVFSVVPGPGVLNAAAALCTAMGNCSPVVCLTGQIPSEYLGRGRGHLHELRDQLATLGSIVKQAVRIDDPRATSHVVNGAFQTARCGRPGPVSVEMCWDLMEETWDVAIDAGDLPCPEPEPDLNAIAAAAEIIARARRPMIMCGAGAQHAAEAVRALAELINAPVTAFRSGRGIVPEDHALGVAAVAARELWDEVDVLICIGSRLEMPFMRWRDPMRYEARPADSRELVRIDIDAAEMTRLVPDVGIVADAATACRLLVDRLATRVTPRPERLEEIASAKRVARSLIAKLVPQAAYLETIRAVLPRDGFLVPEVSQVGFATYTGAYPVLAPRTYVTEGFQGTLGFGFPTALGVKVAHRDRPVVSIAGDGGFMFAAAELATAAQYDIGLVTLVFNNRSYGNVLRDQQTLYGGHVTGAWLENPDFVRFAESFGVAAWRVGNPEELKPVLANALANNRPALIEVVVAPGTESSPWPLIHMPRRPSAV
ncbi:MAG TPA: thiamine pyrophosphate-dependent enzyme [Gammaproteobacteria bacterium]